ncbi:MAG: cytochrome c [Bauldia sp.]|nr:cytochrome c [Bauldia sp.]
MRHIPLAIILFAGAGLSGCGGDDPAARGEAIVIANCSACHATGASGDSPRAGAPPFRELAQHYPLVYLEEALAEGIMTGHNEMPQFVFDPDEIADVIAYLASIQVGTPAPAAP